MVVSIRRLLPLLALLFPTQTQAQGAGNPSFNLVNQASQAINEVYATPAGTPRWGQDRLGRSLLPAGQSFPVRLPANACIYDIRVVYADGRREERRQVNACAVDSIVFPDRRP